MHKLFFVVLVLGAPVFCWGQGEGNIWHFGHHAGIDFNSGTATAINSPIHADWAATTISDSAGNLMFSTDGYRVYDSTGGIMCIGLFGDTLAPPAAFILPFPGHNNQYYIFTVDDPANSPNHGICYSIIDMNLNGGLGGIVSINNQLVNPCCAKITAVRNCNTQDYWVITHAYPSNEFYVYPITTLGVGAPIIQPLGLPIYVTPNGLGYMKCSPNGKKLAVARTNYSYDPAQFFDFDASTGIISNLILIPNLGNPPLGGNPFGVSFSSDNSKLYIGYWLSFNTSKIYQYDLSIPNFQNFPINIALSGNNSFSDLQLGPDGKIYCSRGNNNQIGVINFPNLVGAACGFNNSGFTLLSGTTSGNGFENILESTFIHTPFEVNLGNDISLCDTNSVILLDAGTGFTDYYWSNGGTSQVIQVSDSGNYSVIVMNSFGCIETDSINFQFSSPNLSINFLTDTLGCFSSSNGAIDLNIIGGTSPYAYQWSNGANTQDLNNLTAGTYTVTVTDSIGCIVSNPPIIIVQINDLQVNNTSFNNLKCHDDTNGFINVTVLNGLSPNNYEWSNGATTEDLNNLTDGTYSVTVSDAGGCTASDTVIITAPNQVIASLTTAADTVFCSVTGGTPSYHYHWSTGAITTFIDSATNGTYTVTVSDINNCTSLASITIESVSTIDGDTNFEIYPNPASGQLIIDNGQWIISEIQITDVLGRRVQSFEFKVQSPVAINVSDFSEGVYFIKLVSSSDITMVKKFVVVH